MEASPPEGPPGSQAEKTQVSMLADGTTKERGVQKTTGDPQQDLVIQYRHTQDCILAYRQALSLRNQQDVCKEADAEHNKMCSGASRAAMDARLAEQFRVAASCSADISGLEVAYYQQTLDLAVRGDPDAQLCFAQSGFDIGRSWSADEVSFYQANAPIYLQNALERGDWRAVQLFATPRRVLGHSKRSLLHLIVPSSQLEQYKLNRLLRLGAVDGYAEQLDAVAFDPELPISAEDRKAAEDWARKEYEKYFRNAPTLHDAPQPCLANS